MDFRWHNMTKKINVAVATAKGAPFEIQKAVLAPPGPDDVLVKIAAVGLCHTDIACREQYIPIPLPHVLGHEGAGIVEAIGENVEGIAVGDHVVLTAYACGECPSCEAHRPTYCHNALDNNFSGRKLDGSFAHRDENGNIINGNFFGQSSFADYALAHYRSAVKVDKDVPIELLGPLACGIQTGAGAVMNGAKVQTGSSIAIFGVGTVGLSAIMAAKVVGCKTIIAIDLNDEKLAFAKELGATHTINGGQGDTVENIHKIVSGGVDYSFECVGVAPLYDAAVRAIHGQGLAVLIGQPAPDAKIEVDMNSVLFGKRLQGSLAGDGEPHKFIPKLVELYKQGRFPFDKLITRYSLNDIQQAVEDLENGKVVKALLFP